MTAAHRLPSAPAAATSDYLGSARVAELHASALSVILEDGARVTAETALALPYRARRHDEVLVIGKDGKHYVVGVIRGRGQLAFSGRNVRLRAAGRLLLDAGDHIHLVAPKLDAVLRKRLRIDVDTLIGRYKELRHEVDGKLAVLTREVDQVVEGRWVSSARRACLKVRDAFHINGKTVRLG